MTDQPDAYRTNDRRVIPLLLLGLVVLFGAAYAAGYYLTSDRIPRGTTVGGIRIGGLTPAAAADRLREAYDGRAAEPIRVVANGERSTIMPAAAGLGVDVPRTVDRAGGGRSWDPVRMWDYLVGGSDEDPVVTVDRAALDRAVAKVADAVDVPATEGRVTFSRGRADARYPQRGVVLDRAASARAVRDAFLRAGGAEDDIDLPTAVAEPRVGKRAVSRAMSRFANPAMSGGVVVRLQGERVRLQPRDFADALSMEAVGGRLEPRLDAKRLMSRLGPALRKVSRAPRDASFTIVGDGPVLVPGRPGVGFSPQGITAGFLDVLTEVGSERTVRLKNLAEPPDLTTAEAGKLGVTEKVSSFSTGYPHADYRNVNLGRAAELVDGTLLRPGETFSLNRTVGERTIANGFTEGFVINDGVYAEDLGGGVSQVATTLFNAAFFAGLKDVEHTPHSFYIDRYPVGREATVAWGSVDLRFKNTTPYGVYIAADIDRSSPSRAGSMRVAMYSTKYWDIQAETSDRRDPTPPGTRQLSGPDCVPHQGYGGFDIDVVRLFRKVGSDRLDHREKMHTRYAPSDSVVCS